MKQTDILLIGLNHKTAPVEIRECLALTTTMLRSALTHFDSTHHKGHLAGVREGVILSTCNRLEVYTLVDDPVTAAQAIVEFLGRSTETSPADFFRHLYFYKNKAAVKHLFNVAVGLDSLVIGEPQILGQITTAYEAALAQGAARTVMSALFRAAIHTGKRARTETAIGVNPASVSSVAANLAESLLGDLASRQVLLIGAGEMGMVAVKSLTQRGAKYITVVNRTYDKAAQLAQEWGGRAINFQRLPEAMKMADIIITSTGAPHIILNQEHLQSAMAQRPDQSMFIIDIAVPRDVATDVKAIPNVHLYDIDDLQQQVEDNVRERVLEIPQVEQIVAEELAQFLRWLSSLDVVSTITDLRHQMETLRQKELTRLFNRLDLDERTEQLVATMTHRLVNKILHQPMMGLKEKAANGDSAAYVSMVRHLFALDTPLDRPEKVSSKVKNGQHKTETATHKQTFI